ncbi:hypothetical protein cyc_08273 [Cyclospora cayetanensis]|uniref:Uncharacterized protein n=1 Tax=Cyclospora cayetanensis TaxID=88456 RepID=A0A1D3D136_9EIME|nr:hypothetical protein cyc_08273 [Cyclospora cayetanensis]
MAVPAGLSGASLLQTSSLAEAQQPMLQMPITQLAYPSPPQQNSNISSLALLEAEKAAIDLQLAAAAGGGVLALPSLGELSVSAPSFQSPLTAKAPSLLPGLQVLQQADEPPGTALGPLSVPLPSSGGPLPSLDMPSSVPPNAPQTIPQVVASTIESPTETEKQPEDSQAALQQEQLTRRSTADFEAAALAYAAKAGPRSCQEVAARLACIALSKADELKGKGALILTDAGALTLKMTEASCSAISSACGGPLPAAEGSSEASTAAGSLSTTAAAPVGAALAAPNPASAALLTAALSPSNLQVSPAAAGAPEAQAAGASFTEVEQKMRQQLRANLRVRLGAKAAAQAMQQISLQQGVQRETERALQSMISGGQNLPLYRQPKALQSMTSIGQTQQQLSLLYRGLPI